MISKLLLIINQIKSKVNVVKYFNNTLWLFISKVLSLFSTVFVGAWVAKYLGAEDFGLLMYSNNLVSLFIPIAMIGLSDTVIKELLISENTKSIDTILGTAFGLKFLFGVISVLLLLGLLILNNDVFEVKVLIAIFSSYLLLQSIEVFDFYFQSQVKSRFVVYSRIIAVSIASIVKIILINLNCNIVFFAIAIVLELLITHFVTFLYFKRTKISFVLKNFDKEYGQSLLKKSWPLLLSGLMFVFYIKIDQIMVKEILGANSAGLYSVAINLSEVWYFIPNIIAASFFPAILSYKTKAQSIYYKRITNLYSLLFWISIVIAVFITLFGSTIINYLYGEEFLAADNILNIYIWSNVFFFFTTISSKWLVAEGFYLHSFYRNILGATINVVLNFILLEKIGVIGAAISTLISYSFVGLFYDLFFKELRVNFKLKLKSILLINI
jgi:O-antigen/teichoic acid export membrane protein